jgi:hypothetical protein
MANFTGRTPSKYIRFVITDSGFVLREIGVNKIGNVGLTFPQVDLTALQDAVRGFLAGLPDFTLTIGGPFSNLAAAAAAASGAAPTLSGAHTILNPLNGALVPMGFGILVGMQQYWTSGDPVFTINHTTANGVLVFDYGLVQNGEGVEFTATLRMAAGSAAPAWGTGGLPT